MRDAEVIGAVLVRTALPSLREAEMEPFKKTKMGKGSCSHFIYAFTAKVFPVPGTLMFDAGNGRN